MTIEKIRDVKEVLLMIINAVQKNALVLYSMSNQVDKNFLPTRHMSDALRRLQLYPEDKN